MAGFKIQDFAIPGVSVLISFLAYSSQYLFLTSSNYILTTPPNTSQLLTFNFLLACLWLSYFRACYTTPGAVPADWRPLNPVTPTRWCKKCSRIKPQRTHHCKTCGTCVVKMDHHCPWTANCVGARNLPHFIRFLAYAVASMTYLELWIGSAVWRLWKERSRPSYLGPTITQLIHLFALFLINSLVLFALPILLIRVLWSVGENKTSIESWEIDRHAAVVRRARANGGYVNAPGGTKIRVDAQEFPFDVDVWTNFKAGLGTMNPLSWINPLARTPPLEHGLENEHNEIDHITMPWPPPDPESLPRKARSNIVHDSGFTYQDSPFDDVQNVAEFRKRQDADLLRQRAQYQRGMRDTGVDDDDGELLQDTDNEESSDEEELQPWERSWTNIEGETLADFGVDEYADGGVVYRATQEPVTDDDDNIPLAEFLRRNKAQ
jgi:palmitoyltransferase